MRLFPGAPGICTRCGREESTLVRQMVFEQGHARKKGLPVWVDPWVPYRVRVSRQSRGGAEELAPVRPREGRALWRDFAALFLARETGVRERPGVLRQMDGLMRDGILPSDAEIRFESFGLRTDGKAKLFEWRHDVFDFPPALLPDERTAGTIEGALDASEEVASVLRLSLRFMHPVADRESPDRDAWRQAMSALITRAEAAYWQALEVTFRQMLTDTRLLGRAAARGHWASEWRDAVRTAATTSFEQALAGFDADADALRRQERARRIFYSGLRRNLDEIGGEE